MADFELKLNAKVVGAETIAVNMVRLRESVKARLRGTVVRSAQELAGLAKTLAPSKTGLLRSSIVAQGEETDKKIVGYVGTDVFYGRILESGWTPNNRNTLANAGGLFMTIRRHGWKRNPRKGSDWGRYIAQRGGRRIVARPFLKPALNAMRGTIRARLMEAVG